MAMATRAKPTKQAAQPDKTRSQSAANERTTENKMQGALIQDESKIGTSQRNQREQRQTSLDRDRHGQANYDSLSASGGGNSYLPQIRDKVSQIVEIVNKSMASFKSTPMLIEKLDQLSEVLRGAETSTMKNESFFKNLTEVSGTLDSIRYQIDKYLRTNALKRKMIASDVRHKITNLMHLLTFQIRLIDSVFVNPPQAD